MKYIIAVIATAVVLTATATAGEQYVPLTVAPIGTPTVTLQHTLNQTDIQGEVVKIQ